MDYKQRDKAQELKYFIEVSTIDNRTAMQDEKARVANLTWNASLFFANAIYLAKPLGYECSLKDFNKFKKQFEKANSRTIDVDRLFEKYWLRNVVGYIYISGTVNSVCFTFDKIVNYRNELQFLYDTFPKGADKKDKIDKTQFGQIRAKYEQEKGVTLTDEGVFYGKWLSEKDNVIEISQINFYFKHFLDFWEEFEFLSAFKEYKSKDNKALLIDKFDFNKLHKQFCSFYPKTPSIKTLIGEQVLHEDEKHYSIKFRSNEVSYWNEFQGEITAHYWQLLLEDARYTKDIDRVKKLIEQTSYWGGAPDLLQHSIRKSKQRFLDAAMDLVINEPDLSGIENEFKKVRIDGGMASSEMQIIFHKQNEYEDFSLNNEDYYELLVSLNRWEEKGHGNYLYDLRSRKNIGYLIMLIVKHDFEHEIDKKNKQITHYYKRISGLIRNSLQRPYSLWEVKCYILMYRRGIIPYLLTENDFMLLGLFLIDRFEFIKEEAEIKLKMLWTKCMEMALYTMRSFEQDDELVAKLIFQVFRQLNSKKYSTRYNLNDPQKEKLERKYKTEKEQAVLSTIENSGLRNQIVRGGAEEYLLPEIFNKLINMFVDYNQRPHYNNGTIKFPLLQWDGLTWLMKCSNYWRYKNQFKGNRPNINSLTNSFFKLYLDRIEVVEIEKYNYSKNEKEKGLPSWSEKIERLEFIDWLYPTYYFYQQQKLGSFLEPRFNFESAKDKYHENNRFTADKLRTHIGVLVQVLRKLILPTIPYGFEKKDLIRIKSRVEMQIVDYLKSHVKDIPEKGRIDLFDHNREWGFNASVKEALLPQIARAINWFDKKEEIINAIASSHDVVKILTLVEWVTSEGVKKKLIDKLQQSDFQAFLENSHWIPEIHHTLLKLSEYPELIKQTQKVITFWEEKIAQKNYRYELQLYQTRLLMSFFNKDEKELSSIEVLANRGVTNTRDISHYDRKQFYFALLKLENEPEVSYNIFDQFVNQYPQFPVMAYNRMAAKINVAKQNGDSAHDHYKEALEEWKEYERKNDDLDKESLVSTFYTNKLFVLLNLEEYNELDKDFHVLEMPYQMLPDNVEIKVKSLVKQKKVEEALIYLERAENYHQFSDAKEIAFIDNLKTEVSGIDNVDELRIYHDRIFNSSPSKLIKIFPERLNGRIEINEFVTKEVALAASKMLDKINTLPRIQQLKNTSKENRYNDLVQLALESRISPWGWTVKDQTRKSFSPSEKDLGEIDLDIVDFNKSSFITCEAFILRGASVVQSHLEKLISDYTVNKKAFLVLIYYVGEHAKFEQAWEKYYKTTLSSIKYPRGYELDSEMVKDVTTEFDVNHSTAVKIGKAVLKSGSIMYHVFANINYKVNQSKKIVL